MAVCNKKNLSADVLCSFYLTMGLGGMQSFHDDDEPQIPSLIALALHLQRLSTRKIITTNITHPHTFIASIIPRTN